MGWGKRHHPVGARDVIREAERVLNGRTLESYIARRDRVPAWSLIALLGHASRVELTRLSTPSGARDPNGWSATVARLAADLVALTWDDPSLTRLQRRSLIPLELNLLGGLMWPPSSPDELHEMVMGAVERPLSPEF
jgi:hypothetical protein